MLSPLSVEPTGLQLVATFLEKGGALEGGTPLSALDGGEGAGKEVVEERRQRLVDCALFIGSFMQWDLALFEKRYIVHNILRSLTAHLSSCMCIYSTHAHYILTTD